MKNCQQQPEYYVASGFRTDCQELLRRFAETESVRYTEFSKIWKEMKFSLIFGGRRNPKDLMMFCEETFRIAKVFWLPPNDFQSRVGGLYLLYGLYTKQPKVIQAKIRITRQEWMEVQCWLNDLEEQEHYDTLYVYWQLIIMDAFYFVYTVHEMKPHMRDSYAQSDDSNVSSGFLESYAQDPQLEQLKVLHDRYSRMKRDIQSAETIKMINPDLFIKTQQLMEGYLKRRQVGLLGNDSTAAETGSGSEDDDDGADIGTKRSRIKQRQFMKLSEATRARRHRQVELSTSDTETTKAPTLVQPVLSSTSGYLKMEQRDPATVKRKGTRRMLPEAVETEDLSSDNSEFEEALHNPNMPILYDDVSNSAQKKRRKSADGQETQHPKKKSKKPRVTWADGTSSDDGQHHGTKTSTKTKKKTPQKKKVEKVSSTGSPLKQSFEKYTPVGISKNTPAVKKKLGRPRNSVQGNPSKVKRLPGRPRKNILNVPSVEKEGPRKRGRPRLDEGIKTEPAESARMSPLTE